ncbi:helix-turn-helix domain-containing protein [Microbacterium aerolatum]|uniref:Helix-turn-helix domain-containing protein n=1 Tax=Microbacterium aerolatum TaxID=153731 RepID=A0A511AET4_9MICO|nr:helix-turn-helix domain-containing protein [Microbacterium aerolatum]GEK86668.1 hypothetical protein MAE01_18440 [Microbacterium aerolatum]GGB18784.1 hypothetical protein GCM10007198_06630 [Microbacterium aerolatum]
MSTVNTTESPDVGHEFVKPQEVARLIPGLTVKKLAEWRYERRGPDYYKFGRVILYDVEELKAWINASAMSAGDGHAR